MFGYVIPSLDVLPADERERFQASYCGLCHALAQQNGQHCRMTLSYDLVFMALVLGSLFELPEEESEMRCPTHPTKHQQYVSNSAYSYAADLSVALAYHKLADDWHDDRSAKARAAMAGLAGAYKKVTARYPHQCAEIEAAMADIRQLEQAAQQGSTVREALGGVPLGDVSPDAAANRFGMLLGNLFASQDVGDEFWADALRLFGARLGKFVYVMDAAMDLEEDARTGSYNPFVIMGVAPEDTREPLEMLAAAVADAFERLPLERDEHLLSSVIYEGMWARYNDKYGVVECAEAAGQTKADESNVAVRKEADEESKGGAAQ